MKVKKQPYRIFRTKEDWDETYWEVFREGSRHGKKDLLTKIANAFPYDSSTRAIFEVMRALI